MGALQFNLLTHAGLRAHHRLLDIGCGSLRAGRIFIPYLDVGKYYGIEPEAWVLEAARAELGADLFSIRCPSFSETPDFDLTQFGVSFDFLLAQSIFTHAALAQVRNCVSRANEVMTDESLFFFTAKIGDRDNRRGEWVYPGCVEYTIQTLRALGEQNGLTLHRVGWPHPNRLTWFCYSRPLHTPPVVGSVATIRRQRDELALELHQLNKYRYVRLGRQVHRVLHRILPKRPAE